MGSKRLCRTHRSGPRRHCHAPHTHGQVPHSREHASRARENAYQALEHAAQARGCASLARAQAFEARLQTVHANEQKFQARIEALKARAEFLQARQQALRIRVHARGQASQARTQAFQTRREAFPPLPQAYEQAFQIPLPALHFVQLYHALEHPFHVPQAHVQPSDAREHASQVRTVELPQAHRPRVTQRTSVDHSRPPVFVNDSGSRTPELPPVAHANRRSSSRFKVRWADSEDPTLYKNAPAQRWRAPGEIQRLLNLVNSGQFTTGSGVTGWTAVKKGFGWGSASELRKMYLKYSPEDSKQILQLQALLDLYGYEIYAI